MLRVCPSSQCPHPRHTIICIDLKLPCKKQESERAGTRYEAGQNLHVNRRLGHEHIEFATAGVSDAATLVPRCAYVSSWAALVEPAWLSAGDCISHSLLRMKTRVYLSPLSSLTSNKACKSIRVVRLDAERVPPPPRAVGGRDRVAAVAGGGGGR